MMKRLITGLVAGTVLAVGQVHAESYNLTLTGASPGGLWSRIGGGPFMDVEFLLSEIERVDAEPWKAPAEDAEAVAANAN